MIKGLNGLKVTSFESRRSNEIEKLIVYHGGTPRVAPSMKEIPLDALNISNFKTDIFSGKTDIFILMTGVGTRMLTELIKTETDLETYKAALKNTKIIARGPKPVAALKEIKIVPDITIKEPNTWRDILSTLDETTELKGLNIYVQEYGITNEQFINALSERGANVKTVSIYRWGLPDDIQPLKEAINSIIQGGEDIVLFTSSQQIVNMFDVASKEGLKSKLYDSFGNTVVGSIGPTTSETLRSFNIAVDYEPDSPKMGSLIREIARVSRDLVYKKRTALQSGIPTVNWKRTDMYWNNKRDKKNTSQFIKACRLEKTDYTPIWIMRQAGRFMREYRDIRSKVSFIELCKTPEIAADVTLMAIEKLNVDAAIIFSDILLILQSLGVDLEYSKNDGPRIQRVLRSPKAVDLLLEFEPESMDYVYEAIKLVRSSLNPDKALIGFAGAPFTVVSYAIEGGGSKNYINTKSLMYRDPGLWNTLMIKITNATASYLNCQIEAGADAVQIFDSWVGCLSPDDYAEYVLPHMKKLVSMIEGEVPVILFGTDTATLLGHITSTGCDVIGVDWRVDIEEAWNSIGYETAIQGNLDPLCLLSTQSYIKNEAKKILDKTAGVPGHIFNLGHGVLPPTPVDNVLALVDIVHEYSQNIEKDEIQ